MAVVILAVSFSEGVAASYTLDDDKTIRCEQCARIDLVREEL